jgi:hypothetical protein
MTNLRFFRKPRPIGRDVQFFRLYARDLLEDPLSGLWPIEDYKEHWGVQHILPAF